MSKRTGISWCDSTANIVIGCAKVSAGCVHCFAEKGIPARVLRHQGIETWGPKGVRHEVKGYESSVMAMNRRPWVCDECGHSTSDGMKPVQPHGNLNSHDWCQCKTTRRRRIFHGSNNDFLDPKWRIETLAKKLDVIRRASECVHILCTKRAELWYERVNAAMLWLIHHAPGKHEQAATAAWLSYWKCGEQVPQNIILLTSVENQEAADERIPHLLRIPAACRGLSLEPLLGPVDLTRVCADEAMGVEYNALTGENWSDEKLPKLDWLIIGGESGKQARPCDVEWIRSLVQQGREAGVPVFVKQVGSNCAETVMDHAPDCIDEHCALAGGIDDCDGPIPTEYEFRTKHPKGGDPSEWPEDLRVQQFPTL